MPSSQFLQRFIPRCVIAAIITSGLLGYVTASAKGLEDRKWIEVRSPNFTILSRQKEKVTRELIEQMELFRAAVGLLSSSNSTTSSVPVKIFLFKDRRDFRPFGLNENTAGRIELGLRDYMIMVRDSGNISEVSIVLHEYVHFLMHNRQQGRYPMWFNEGYAEYLSTVRRRDGRFDIGLVPPHRAADLKTYPWIDYPQLIAASTGKTGWTPEQTSMFYAQSWALVHYLQNAGDSSVPFASRIDHYSSVVEESGDHHAAFESAFDIGVDEIQGRVTQYLERNDFRYLSLPEASLAPEIAVTVRTPPREEVAYDLGVLAFRRDQYKQAQEWFSVAAETEQSRARARAEAGLADAARRLGDNAGSQSHIEVALELAPDDPMVHLGAGNHWLALAHAAEEGPATTDKLYEARKHFVESWKLDDSIPETYAMYGTSFLFGDVQPEKAIEMLEEAAYRLPGHPFVRMRLANAYAAGGRTSEAMRETMFVLAWGHGNEATTQEALTFIEWMQRSDR